VGLIVLRGGCLIGNEIDFAPNRKGGAAKRVSRTMSRDEYDRGQARGGSAERLSTGVEEAQTE